MSGIGKEASAFKLGHDAAAANAAQQEDDTKQQGFCGYDRRTDNRKKDFLFDKGHRPQCKRYSLGAEWLKNTKCRCCGDNGHLIKDCPEEKMKKKTAMKKLGIKNKADRKTFLNILDDMVDLRNNKMNTLQESDDDSSSSSDSGDGSDDDGLDYGNSYHANVARAALCLLKE